MTAGAFRCCAHFGLKLSPGEFMMRCAVCNGRGYALVSKEEATARGDCPPKVLASIDEFYACRSCGKLYWEGPKSSSAFDHFGELMSFGTSVGPAPRQELGGAAPARLGAIEPGRLGARAARAGRGRLPERGAESEGAPRQPAAGARGANGSLRSR